MAKAKKWMKKALANAHGQFKAKAAAAGKSTAEFALLIRRLDGEERKGWRAALRECWRATLRLTVLLQPRYKLSEDNFMRQGPEGTHVPYDSVIRFGGVPNCTMQPLNLQAFARAMARRFALRVRTAWQESRPPVAWESKSDSWQVPNFIPEPRERRDVSSSGRGWYDHKPNVVPLRPDVFPTEKKD